MTVYKTNAKINSNKTKELYMHDTLEQIECPACGKIMQKIPMSESGTMIDICLDGCGGIFFDGQELKHFDEQKGHDRSRNISTGKQPDAQTAHKIQKAGSPKDSNCDHQSDHRGCD